MDVLADDLDDQREHEEHVRRQTDGTLAHLRVEIAFIGEQLRTLALSKVQTQESGEYWRRYYSLLSEYKEVSGSRWET